MTSVDVLGELSEPSTCAPSGPTEDGRWSAPVPSAARQKRFIAPARRDAKMMRRLSGVQIGNMSRAESKVRRVSVWRVRIPRPDVAVLIANIEREAGRVRGQTRHDVGPR